MSSGLSTVVTNTTGLSEYITDGVNGFKVDYGNTKRLSGILYQLDRDRKLLNDMSEQGKLIYEKLQWSEVLADYKRIYNKLIN